MAWTTPKTYSSLEDLTYTEMNTYQRDNLNETAPAVATATGRLIVTDGANSVVERVPTQDIDTGLGTLTNTSYLSLANLTGGTPFGGEVAVTVTTGTLAVVLFAAQIKTTTAGGNTLVSYAVSGATTTSANDNWCLQFESSAASDLAQFATFYLATVTAGSNTFTLQARVTAGTGTITDPRILVIPL